MSILFGGLAERVKDGGEIRIAYTSAYAEKYEKFAPSLEEKLSIIGPLALLLSIFEIHKFPALCILPYARVYEYDLKAALVALKILKEKFDSTIDLSRIEKDIIKERKEEMLLMEQLEKTRQSKPESKIFYM
jgi:Archaeal enzymes of ATP-grasp superfamily